MGHSGGFMLPVTVIYCEGERQEKNEKVMVSISNRWIFIFPRVTHLLKNGRKLEIFKREGSLSQKIILVNT